MKRAIIFSLLFAFAFTFLVAVTAQAGIFDTIKDKVSGAAVWALITVVFGAAGVFLKGRYDINKAKTALVEISHVVSFYKKARTETSNGGERITTEEWAKIGKEGMEAIIAVLYALPVKWQKKIKLVR